MRRFIKKTLALCALIGVIAAANPAFAHNPKGYTSLHYAALKGNIEEIKAALEAGVDINARHKRGYTALHWAAAIGHLDIITILVESGADLEAITVKGQTPLHIATALDQILVVTALLNAGANLEASLDAQYPRWRQGG